MPIFQVSIRQSLAGSSRPIANVFDVYTATGPGGSFPQAMAEFIRDLWWNTWKDHQTAQLRIDEVRVRERGGIAFFDLQSSHAGSHAGAAVPPNTAVLIKKTTPGIARKRWGSIYLAGFPEDIVDHGGNIHANNQSIMTNKGKSLLAGLATQGYPMAQLDVAGFGGGGTPAYALVESLDCAQKVATQRRRLRK